MGELPTYRYSVSDVEDTTAYAILTISSPLNGTTTTSDTITVTGMTIPGSTVTINGQPVNVDAQGNFSMVVTLVSGSNDIIVTATAPDGGNETVTNTVTYNTGVVQEMPSWLLPVAGVGVGLLTLLLLSQRRKKG